MVVHLWDMADATASSYTKATTVSLKPAYELQSVAADCDFTVQTLCARKACDETAVAKRKCVKRVHMNLLAKSAAKSCCRLLALCTLQTCEATFDCHNCHHPASRCCPSRFCAFCFGLTQTLLSRIAPLKCMASRRQSLSTSQVVCSLQTNVDKGRTCHDQLCLCFGWLLASACLLLSDVPVQTIVHAQKPVMRCIQLAHSRNGVLAHVDEHSVPRSQALPVLAIKGAPHL